MSSYSTATIRQWLIDHSLIAPDLTVLNVPGIYFNAQREGVTSSELDAALNLAAGTVAAEIASRGWSPLTGVPQSPAPVGNTSTAPSPPPVVVSVVNPAPVVVAPAPSPRPATSVTPAPAPSAVTPQGPYVVTYPATANPADEPMVGIDPGPMLQGISTPTLLALAAGAFFLLRK